MVDRILMTALTIHVFPINSLHILRCLSSAEGTLLIVVTVNELFESFAIEVLREHRPFLVGVVVSVLRLRGNESKHVNLLLVFLYFCHCQRILLS